MMKKRYYKKRFESLSSSAKADLLLLHRVVACLSQLCTRREGESHTFYPQSYSVKVGARRQYQFNSQINRGVSVPFGYVAHIMGDLSDSKSLADWYRRNPDHWRKRQKWKRFPTIARFHHIKELFMPDAEKAEDEIISSSRGIYGVSRRDNRMCSTLSIAIVRLMDNVLAWASGAADGIWVKFPMESSICASRSGLKVVLDVGGF